MARITTILSFKLYWSFPLCYGIAMARLRNLGYWESLCALAHNKLNATGLMFTRIQIRGHIPFDLLIDCLKNMFLRHPLLRATLHQSPQYYYFKINNLFSNIPISAVGDLKSIERFIEKSIKEPLSTDQYLWKAVLFSEENKNELVLFFHHSIADGLSSLQFTDELLKALSSSAVNSKQIESLPLLDPIEKLVNPFLLQTKEHSTSKDFRPTTIYYQSQADFHERVTKNIFKVISFKKLQKIKTCCKKNKITVNAFFNAALLISMQKMLGKKIAIQVVTPINLRTYSTPEIKEEHIGCYINCIDVEMELTPFTEDIAFIAQQYQASLQYKLAHFKQLPEELNLATSALPPFFDIKNRDYFLGIAISNKGKATLAKNYGPLKLTGYFTSSSRQAGDLAMNLSLTTVQDRVYCCFTYTKPLLSVERATNLVKDFFHLIDSLEER